MIYWKLFIAFFRIGIFGYGGGPSMIPLFHSECVKKYQWVTAEDFSDNLALGNALPGPIATKMASFIGYRVKGWAGAIVAILALTLPVVVAMIGLLSFIYVLKDASFFKGMVQAIQPVIGVMMAVLAYEFVAKGWKDAQKKGGVAGMLLLSVLVIPVFHISPGLYIGAVLLITFLYSTWVTRLANRKKQQTSEGVGK